MLVGAELSGGPWSPCPRAWAPVDPSLGERCLQQVAAPVTISLDTGVGEVGGVGRVGEGPQSRSLKERDSAKTPSESEADSELQVGAQTSIP